MTALSILRETLDAVAAVVFPAPCRVCGETLVTGSRVPICGACLARLGPLEGPMCGRCGRPLVQGLGAEGQGLGAGGEGLGDATGDSRESTANENQGAGGREQGVGGEGQGAGSRGQGAVGKARQVTNQESRITGHESQVSQESQITGHESQVTSHPAALCHLCRRNVYAFEVARSFTAYDEHATRAIVLLKHHAIAPLGAWFAARVAEMVRREGITADVVVPVPLHRARQRERGHNQAELIARPLAKLLGLPMSAALLVRTKPRPAAHRLTRKERWTSVRGAYGTREGARVDKQRVLLIDDVFTTGATLDACSRALLDAGASGVIGVTVARVVPHWEPLHPLPASTS